MDNSIKKQIIGIRSKYCEPILELLAQEGELYHGDLSEKLNVSPSGLNVIIKKMQECDPPIIEIMQTGKYKIYTLPPKVREYMECKKNEKSALEREDETGPEFTEEENILLCLQHFIEKAGSKWRDIFNLLLQGIDVEIDKEVKIQYAMLMKTIAEASKYKKNEMDEFIKFLDNDVLKYLVKQYLDEIKECKEILQEIEGRENGEKLIRPFEVK